MTLANEPFDFAQAFADGVLLEHLTGVSPSQYVNQEIMKSITGIRADNKWVRNKNVLID